MSEKARIMQRSFMICIVHVIKQFRKTFHRRQVKTRLLPSFSPGCIEYVLKIIPIGFRAESVRLDFELYQLVHEYIRYQYAVFDDVV